MTDHFDEESENFQIAALFSHLKRYWLWLVIGCFTSLAIAFFYLRYSSELYRSTSTILVVEDNPNSISEVEFNGLELINGNNGAESEAEILRSRTLLKVVAKNLQLNKSFFAYGGRTGIKQKELYNDRPIEITSVIHDSVLYEENVELKIKLIDKTHYTIELEDGEEKNIEENKPFVINEKKYILHHTDSYSEIWNGRELRVKITPLEQTVSHLRNTIEIGMDKSDIGILTIQIDGFSIEKNNEIINELIDQHQKAAIREKNKIAEDTHEFLKNRLTLIEGKLEAIEQDGQQLRTKHGIVDVEAEVSSIIGQESILEEKLLEYNVKLGIAQQMQGFVQSNEDYESLIPVNLGFESPTLANAVEEYNELVIRRNNLLHGSSESNPIVKKMKTDLNALKGNLLISLNSLVTSLSDEAEKFKKEIAAFENKKQDIPKFELEYQDMMRDQQIREAIYLLLLQKKEENEIILASNQGNIRVVDYAFSTGMPISPKKKMVYLSAFILGLLIPSAIVSLIFLLDNKLKNGQDLERMGLPTIGEIPRINGKQETFDYDRPKSQTVEAFGLLRSNINFILNQEKSSHVIMITSTVSGEGKTFVSIQLANSLANTMKKVVLVGMDLRAPKLMKYLDLSSHKVGISNYLVRPDITLEDIKIQSPGKDNVTIIPSGAIPPNPNELLLRSRVNELFETLKEQYDYIIVDTSPVGLVADTFSIARHSDLTLYVARADFLDKRKLAISKKLHEDKKLDPVFWVINGIDMRENEYGYGYGYGYGAESSQDQKKGFGKKLQNLWRPKKWD